MTWLNTGARVISLTAVLPLVLRTFNPADIALYYLFASMIALQLLAGSGFIPTFSRFVSYALAGATSADFDQLRDGATAGLKIDRDPDTVVVSQLVGTLHRVFLILALGSMPVVVAVGCWLLRKPIGASADTAHAWLAWATIVAITPVTLYANQYSALLQGANKVALEQRWSAIFVIAGALSGLVALLVGGGLLALVAVNQLWQVASFVRLAWLSRRTLRDLPYDQRHAQFSPAIFRAVWPSSWKSFVGVAASGGIVSASGLVFAQRLEPVPLAEFLFGVRIMSIISEVSRAPFYSKIPQFNGFRARGDLAKLAAAAKKCMQIALMVFVMLTMVAPIGAALLLPLFGSKIAFPGLEFWLLFGLATLIERWGAMHMQLYSTTNVIVWHWISGLTGALWVALMATLEPRIGLYAYPLAMLVAHVAIYSRISSLRSLRSLSVNGWSFERHCGAVALALYLFCGSLLVVLRFLLPAFVA